VVSWLDAMGYYAKGIDEFADADAVRFRANHYVTGRDGGRDIDLRAFARDGMRLHGRLSGITGGTARFAGDLRANLDHADAVSESIKDSIDGFITAQGIDAPTEARYTPVWQPSDGPTGGPADLDLTRAGISTVVWSAGFGRDYRWIEAPVFDGRGHPAHQRGVTNCPGLYFLGLPWLHTWGSGRFSGVAADAGHLVEQIRAYDRRKWTDSVPWIAGTPTETYPDREWFLPTVAVTG
jgi:putative flavoprotein involved in K+ transport